MTSGIHFTDSEISIQNSTKVIYTLLRKEKYMNFAMNTEKVRKSKTFKKIFANLE